jgi:uncharacterized protein (TIGR02145 family)
MKKHTFLFLVFLIPFIGISQLFTPGAGVTDIDGNTYQTIVINGQEWMAENLRTSKYSNGEVIPNIPDNSQWSTLTTGAWSHYNNDSQYENPYGKLYNWYTVADPRNVCPTGWHVPSDAEWTVLTDYLGGVSVAGGKMKSTGTQYWESPNQDATNESGFSGLPGSSRFLNGSFDLIGYYGYWWSSTEYNTGDAWTRNLLYYDGDVYRHNPNKPGGFSVRCLNNSTSSINEITPSSKTLIKVFDLLGNETVITPNELQFYLYSDGSVEKKIVLEK